LTPAPLPPPLAFALFNAEPDGRIVPDDTIVAVQGIAVESVARLMSRIDDHQAGATVRLTVLREVQKTDVKVTLQTRNQ